MARAACQECLSTGIIGETMSGHSKWATIHRQKGINDAKKGNIFSKLSRAITIAVKTGGGASPDSNFRLRVEIDRAREANMPKDNIERAIVKASGAADVEEVTYEGFGPNGINVVVQAATDNRNRTGQEIKGMFEKSGGSMGGPGAVLFNFENKGYMFVAKKGPVDDQELTLIDAGVEDMEETPEGFDCYTSPEKLGEVSRKLTALGFTVTQVELYLKPKSLITLTDPEEATRALKFLEALTDHDDVQKVSANLDIPSGIIKND